MAQMTDSELADYCGFKPTDDQSLVAKFIAELPPARRALYDRMCEVEIGANLWTAGLGPKPRGVILDGPKQCREGKRR